MKPVFQTKLYAPESLHRGDCMAACIASLLECELWMVPNFAELRGLSFSDAIHRWSQLICEKAVNVGGHPVEELPEFYIACGQGPRGVDHSCIYSHGQLVHDPHPVGGGLKTVEFCWYFEKRDR